MVRLLFAAVIALAASGTGQATEAELQMERLDARVLLEQVDGFKTAPNGGRAIAAPTVLAYSPEGRLLSVSAMREVSAENLLEERLTASVKASGYTGISNLVGYVPGLALRVDDTKPTFVMIFPPQARTRCEPCRTVRDSLESLLDEQDMDATVVEIDVISAPPTDR